mgnify:CR=1 FL=1
MPYPFELRPLPFSYTALSPEISETTLHFHHDKHLQAYVDNLNKALTDCPELQRLSLEELLQTLDQIPEPKRTAIRNNGGGVYNHYLYFDCMGGKGGHPCGPLAQAMDRAFGSYEEWKLRMKEAYGAIRLRLCLARLRQRRRALRCQDPQPRLPHHPGAVAPPVH